MSIHNLVDTRSLSFHDFAGNGKQFRVPPFQRDYSWTEEQWDDLWKDIETLRASTDARHYMGAVVVEAESDRSFVVIDGQQRLVTLSVLALAVIGRLHELAGAGNDPAVNRDRADTLTALFIGNKNPASLVVSSKLTLNETDDGFFQDYLVAGRTPVNPRALPRSNRLLWDCHLWFARKLREDAALANDGRLLAELLSECVDRQLLFIVIVVDDELNAYTVFETLNARGLELSATDLLKNYLFSRVRANSDLKALQRRWKQLIAVVRQERFPDFLRHHLLCEVPKIRSSRLFKLIRDRVREPQQVFELIASLESRAELFAALTDVTHEFWVDSPECLPGIRERQLLGSQLSTPLLFAAWEKFTRADFARVVKLVNVLTFRFSTIGNQNPNDLEAGYHRSAKAVIDGAAKSVAAVFETLRDFYIPDDRFRSNFESCELSWSSQGRRLARYILAQFERDASGRDIDPETDSGTIEHILPANPSDDWLERFTEAEVARFADRLGNLALLEGSLNRSVGNGTYAGKAAAYAESGYLTTRRIVERSPDDWTKDRIAARQREMAARAVHIWKSDFQ